MNKIFFFLILFVVLVPLSSYSQSELVPSSHPVYDFLKRMSLEGLISDYNSSVMPLSRKTVAGYLKTINSSSDKTRISTVDKKILDDYFIEFGYEIYGDLRNASKIYDGWKIFDDKKQKFVYAYADSNATFFLDAMLTLRQGLSSGDSLGKHSITLFEPGLRFRGTLFNSVGYYLRLSNGQRLGGTNADVDFAQTVNPKWKANHKMKTDNGNYDTYEGYLRYATNSEWIALTVGKEQVTAGFGYIDKLFLSDNCVPYSFARVDLKYKALHWFFLYGSLRGDSLGKETNSKYITTHRLNITFSDVFKVGMFESLIISDRPFNFTYLNPFNVIRSADYNAGSEQSGLNNAFMGLDFELQPVNKFSLQAAMLVDDLNFKTLFSNEKDGGKPANDNRFGWQAGLMWTDAFTLPDLTLAFEYTRLNPFVYSHRSNKSQYTNWGVSLGHNLPPNSDEIALKLNYDLTNRINFKFLYQHQRSGNGLVFNGDTLVLNYGGDINRGDADVVIKNSFLQGNRINRDIFTLNVTFQPVRQYFLEAKFVYEHQNLLYSGRKINDYYAWLIFRLDY